MKNNPEFNEEELLTLIGEILDGDLEDLSRERLHDILESSRAARRFFRDHMELHANLDFDYSGGLGLDGMPGEKADASMDRVSRFRTLMFVTSGVFIAAFCLIALQFFRGDSGNEAPSATNGIAVLSRALNVEWKRPDKAFEEGSVLMNDRLELASGIVEIEFFSGASVILQGPADLELMTEKLAICHEGRLRALVPEPAKGFTISTSRFDAVDIGTEFAMSIDPEGHNEIHVIDGQVDVHEKGGDLVRQLHAGDAAREAGDINRLESIVAQGEQFVDWQQLQTLKGEYSESRYQDWRNYREKWIADPDTILYFDFEDHEPWERQLKNARAGNPNGGIIGAQWVRGRWPEKSALEFKRPTDRVRLDVPGEWDAVTFAAWVRVEGLDRRHNGLFLADEWNRGDVHWHIGEQGQLTFAINSVGRKRTEPLLDSAVLGRWLHLAVTYDSVENQITHYLNGRPVESGEADGLSPIVIGGAEIGNWKAHSKKTTELRSFNGRIDELLVLGRAMSPGEIAEHFSVGNPYR